MLIGYSLTRYLGAPLAGDVVTLYSAFTYYVIFFAVTLPCVGLQYLENKYLWSRMLTLKDNLSFMGVSYGLAIGILSLGKW